MRQLFFRTFSGSGKGCGLIEDFQNKGFAQTFQSEKVLEVPAIVELNIWTHPRSPLWPTRSDSARKGFVLNYIVIII